MERKKVSDYNKKQEDIARRKKEKEVELKRSMNEKINDQQLRESRLIETRLRYEKQTEEYKEKLSSKLNSIDGKVIL